MDRLLEGLGQVWHAGGVALKKYPCCHIIASYLDAIFDLKAQHALNPSEILEVVCFVHPIAAQTVCEPLEEKHRPSSGYSAQFSLPYSIAVALEEGEVGCRHYTDDEVMRPSRVALANKVQWVPDGGLPYPEKLSAKLEIVLASGARLHHEVEYSEGAPERPMTFESLQAKFFHNAEGALGKEEARRLCDSLMRLETVTDVSGEIMARCRSLPKLHYS